MTEGQDVITIQAAAEQIGVRPATLYYYIRKLKLTTKRFEFDPLAYLARDDFVKIKSLKDAARLRAQQAKNL